MKEEMFSKDFAIVRKLYKESKDLVKQVVLFGSVAEGTWNEESDIDVLFVTRENQTAKFNNRVRKVCRSRGLKIGHDIVVEDLRGYNRFYPEMRHRLHLLEAEVGSLSSNEPILSSVKKGIDITKELDD